MNCSMPGLPVPHHLPEFAQVHVHWISDVIQPSHLLLPSSSAPNLSQHQGLFQWVGCVRWPKYWSFSFSISPTKEYSGLISFKIDWFGSSCCPRDSQEPSPRPQFKSINSSVLCLCYGPALYMTTGKTIWTFVSKVMSWLFNTLSGFVIAFLPRNNSLLISWLSPSIAIPLCTVNGCFHATTEELNGCDRDIYLPRQTYFLLGHLQINFDDPGVGSNHSFATY